ncbi:DUF423 domain-containing protein [Allorhizobium pseudoryzae]|jgi:uncharacterized membrane protein YgdD (TMEM256/DUF423 family)|uniref:DUF423 domain-containing protein n=1 Tax=Allorhizobium pseudoryzae TaxID=379684 RepID=UPI0013ED2929|nr:DUF423 domain-containing protein [Allorhizobium pseudoryzae]
MRLSGFRPAILMLAGFMGASGVMLAAAASHGGDGRLLGSASAMCLAHAPVLLALYLADGRIRTANLAALVLALGTVLFCADLLSRHFAQSGLFPMAAPSGGMLMILGWLLIASGGLMRENRT